MNHLSSLGHTVNIFDDDGITAAAANGADLVFISQTVSSGRVGSSFTSVGVPVISAEPWLFDDLNMTLAINGTSYGTQASITTLDIVNASHPIAAGLSGTVQVYDAPSYGAWGVPVGGTIIATLTGDPSRATIFAFDTNEAMANGQTAAARRVGISIWDTPTADVLDIFTAAVDWVVGG